MSEDVIRLVEYRLAQARQTLDAGRQLLTGRYFRDAVNRAYYAMFYASLGLLASRQLGSSKHTGVLSLFGQHFVNTGSFSSATGAYLRQAFELRQKCDYREFVEPTPGQAEEIIRHAGEFLAEAERTWQSLRPR
ncbi:MAG: HEPN domain-containing protein [Planctomycetes bacterium]|nr:HEPN domain-containing protein [Planctomycetota bacterium]